MIRLILAVAFAIFTAALGAFLALNPGTAQFQFLGWQAELPFVVAAGGIIVFAFLFLVFWWLVFILWTSPDKLRAYNKRRQREKGYDALERALIASAAGEGEAAVRQAARADALLERPALSRLLAARAAEAAGNVEGAEAHYEALLEDPKTRLVARRGLAQLAHDRGDHRDTALHARDAFDRSRDAHWAFEALFDAQLAEARWDDALETLAEGERRKQIGADRAARRRAVLLTASALACETTEPAKARDNADTACRAAPGFAPAATLAARLMVLARRHKRASDLLETAWATAPHPALARAYRDLRKSDTRARRAERIKGLAALQPDHRESKLLLVQAALDDGDARFARSLLDPFLNDAPVSARLCALAARLARLEGEDEQARRWMTRAAHAPAEADWSDMDPDGRAFPYDETDWIRMVYVFGDENRLIHPRYERFEGAIEAVPETALLDAPKKAPRFVEPAQTVDPSDLPRLPDDPGVPGEDEEDGRAA